MRKRRFVYLLLPLVPLLAFCRGNPAPMDTVPHVDIDRFMGDWYVIASVPTWFEREAYDAVETYRLDEDGTIDTTFTYRKGSHDAPEKKVRSRGFVYDTETNAEWRIQFFWPFKAEYLVVHVDEDYTRTIIARRKRDYAWIMAREPVLAEDEYKTLVSKLVALGYDREAIRRVPQSTE